MGVEMFVIEILNGKSYKRIAEKRSITRAYDMLVALARATDGTYRIKQGKRVVFKRAYVAA